MSDEQDSEQTAIAILDDVKQHLTAARGHQHGTATDVCLRDLIQAVAHLEGVVRTLVVGAAG